MTDALPQSVSHTLRAVERRDEASRLRVHEKADRATAEQVLDPRTRLILFKLLNRGVISELHGCISTGKEANVYHSFAGNGGECAVKVYKTSILVFKDRDRYVTGDFRFRRGYSKSNPRKMVRVWAEKETRNLNRLAKAGIPCPKVICLNMHVLVMDFLGHDGWPAPKLKDAQLGINEARVAYKQLVLLMQTMYQKAKLVHADLSEYNILYHDGQLYIIDVSQAVEHDHPHALDFLRQDCANATEFFRRAGVNVMRPQQLFNFVTDPTVTEENREQYLEKIQEEVHPSLTASEQIDEAVFLHAFIPRTLSQVPHFEHDQEQAQAGAAKDVYYAAVTGLADDLSGARQAPEVRTNPMNEILMKADPLQMRPDDGQDDDDDDDDEDEDDDEDDEDDEDSSDSEDNESDDHSEDDDADSNDSDTQKKEQVKIDLGNDLRLLPKAERKKLVKEMQREKRKNKIPKKVKKRKERVGKQRK